jgi:hypothetical protein
MTNCVRKFGRIPSVGDAERVFAREPPLGKFLAEPASYQSPERPSSKTDKCQGPTSAVVHLQLPRRCWAAAPSESSVSLLICKQFQLEGRNSSWRVRTPKRFVRIGMTKVQLVILQGRVRVT